MSIGARIRSLRIKNEWSLADLADRSDTTEFYLYSAEQNIHSTLDRQFLEKVARALSVSADDLMADESALDQEWLAVTKEAMESNVTTEQFKAFLAFKKQQKTKNTFTADA